MTVDCWVAVKCTEAEGWGSWRDLALRGVFHVHNEAGMASRKAGKEGRSSTSKHVWIGSAAEELCNSVTV